MPADLLDETRIPLSEACRHPLLQQGRRPGRPIHRATLERWRIRGLKGVRLETALIAGTRITTAQAIRRFFERVNAQPDAPAPDMSARHESAERELEAAGL